MRFIVTQTLPGEIAAQIVKTEAAERHFTRAIEKCRETGWSPEVTWAEYHYAELLLGRDEAGDHEMAVKLQDEAIAIAQELGMKPLMERVLGRREMLKA